MNKKELGVGLAVATATAAAGWWLRQKKEEQVPTHWVEVGSIEELLIYPLKSGAPLQFKEVECSPQGVLVGDNRDRMLAVVREDGSLVTGRDFNKLVSVAAEVSDGWTVTLCAKGFAPLTVNLEPLISARRQLLKIWKSEAEGVDCGEDASEWLTSFLGSKVRLLIYPNKKTGKRMASLFNQLPFVNVATDGGAFSDGAAFHLINTKSVDELNTRLTQSVHARNFRPNLIVSGEKLVPYEEDNWQWVKIGDTVFRALGPCTRCLLTTVNPWTAEKSELQEPLKTLHKYRGLRDPSKRAIFGLAPVMGVYLGLRSGPGTIKTGDKISVAVS